MHLVLGQPACKHGDKCKYTHMKEASKEDKEWANKRKGRDRPRVNSPAAASRSNSGGSDNGSRRPRSSSRRGKKNKGDK